MQSPEAVPDLPQEVLHHLLEDASVQRYKIFFHGWDCAALWDHVLEAWGQNVGADVDYSRDLCGCLLLDFKLWLLHST